MKYRIHKSSIPHQLPLVHGNAFVRVTSNSLGVTLDRVAITDQIVVRNKRTGQLGYRGEVIQDIAVDPSDSDFFTCTTKELVLSDDGMRAFADDSNWLPVKVNDELPRQFTEVETANVLPLGDAGAPLRFDEGGVVRVGNSRISLDLVVEQYESGVAPEDMVRAYDTLSLSDVHATIAYYLKHREDVKAYLKRRAEDADALRAKIESERPRLTRDELLARRDAREQAHAATGE
jgi:uncharacterized protein (DUF433 family)